MPSIRLPDTDGDRKPGIRYRGGSAELVFRCRITFGIAVIVVNLIHPRVVISPEERSGVTMPVDRPMSPVAVFGPEPLGHAPGISPVEFVFGPVRRTIMTSLVQFVLEPGARAIKITPGVIAPIAVPVKILICGSIKFLNAAASIRTAVAASFALGPGITR